MICYFMWRGSRRRPCCDLMNLVCVLIFYLNRVDVDQCALYTEPCNLYGRSSCINLVGSLLYLCSGWIMESTIQFLIPSDRSSFFAGLDDEDSSGFVGSIEIWKSNS